MCVKAPYYRKDILVRVKIQFEGFDNATQPQKPHWESAQTFEECLANFKRRLEARGYPKEYIESSLPEVTFDSRQLALKSQKHKTAERILPFVTTYHPAINKLKQIVMENWRFIENQPMLKTIFKNPPIISYKKGKSLKEMLVRAKL